MKKLLITAIIIGMATIQSMAQSIKTEGNRGTWVIEYNSKYPKLQTVKFYNDSARLVYQETVDTKLNISNKRIQNALNEICANLCEKDRLQNLRAAVAIEQLEKH
jgi:hypothetical protein